MSNDFVPTDTKTIESEASAWLAQLDAGNMSTQDLAAFQEWMQRSPLHQIEVKDLAELWGDLNVLTDLMEPIAVASTTERELKKNHKVRFSFNLRPITAVLLLMSLTIFGITNLYKSNPQILEATLLATDIGEHKMVLLSDGSKITLNTHSMVEVDFTQTTRKVRLLQGEAIFDVFPNKERPFLVYAGDGVIKAVGTVFSVHLKDEIVNVSVTEGAVELSPVLEFTNPQQNDPKKPLVTGYIKAGHKAVLRNHRAQIVPTLIAEIESELSWQDGLLTFSGEPLKQVVSEISRYTTTRITISDPSIENISIGGIFPSGDIEALFEVLEAGFGVAIERPSETEVILSRKKEL